ncbi:Conserved regulator of innate immunity protein [Dirofilaria immitis]
MGRFVNEALVVRVIALIIGFKLKPVKMRSIAICRALSRSLQRHVSTATVCSRIRISHQILLARQMSSTRQLNNELIDALKNEITAEKQLEKENLRGEKAPVISGFEIKTDGANVQLAKLHGNEKINVYFNVNHSVDMDGEEDEDDGVPLALPSLTIEIIKAQQRLCFYLDLCENEEATEANERFDFRVAEFYIAPVSKGTEDEEIPESVYSSSGKYIDPNLHDLLFNHYLAERGFDQKFCREVVDFATHYEHSQYVKLLTDIQSFVSK